MQYFAMKRRRHHRLGEQKQSHIPTVRLDWQIKPDFGYRNAEQMICILDGILNEAATAQTLLGYFEKYNNPKHDI